ncbi:glycosyltransferase family 2 protein [Ferruginibacter sp.]|uniref:glycosyltransferase family 2 protein n=1 Tax=Ferruginibacter sp. TaxID=1940288 RepID=UPI0019967C5B|nr:glycosyltransferase family 2 protein [Ferruginibacter sp.]MBC7628921.1 glycosyltransferase family 2 protein [Ferruginibacter sp.]
MPKVSICIPAYNQDLYLRKTIDSILSQTYQDYEIVITDDSPGNIVKELAQGYQRPELIKYFKNATTLGSPENWNEAMRQASGEYIKLLHHDDWLSDPDSLAKYVAMLDENPGADYAFSATQAQSPAKNWDHMLDESQLKILKENPLVLYSNNLPGAPSTGIFRRSVDMFFDPKLKWLVDIEFYIRMLHHNNHFIYTPELLLVTYVAEGRVTDECLDNKEVEIFEYLYVLNSIYKQRNQYSKTARKSCLLKAINICEKYDVNSRHEVVAYGYTGKMPRKLRTWLALKAMGNLPAKIYRTMLTKH